MECTIHTQESVTKSDSRRKYPENMSKEAVSVMYIDKSMTRGQIADYYGITICTVNNFLSRNGIKRNDIKPKRMSGTVTKLSKSELRSHGKDADHEKCSVCEKDIYFSCGMNRRDYAYKFTTSRGKVFYCCGWSHFLKAKGKKRKPVAVNEY